MTAPCDVCRILDGDETPKEVTYCHLCDAHLCKRDRKSFIRRALAFTKKGRAA